MDETLVALTPASSRDRCLHLADHLSQRGICSVLVPALAPAPIGAGSFAVAVPRWAAHEAARHLTVWSENSEPPLGAYRTAARSLSDEDPPPSRRRRLAAFFAIGFGFGLGHVYGREYAAGLIVMLGQVACLVLATTATPAALWAFPALVGLDLWGGLRAVDRENDGRRRVPASQLATTLPAVALLLAGAAVILPPPSSSSPRAHAQAVP